jgi:hypothetical protein
MTLVEKHNPVASADSLGHIMETVLVRGDLSPLTPHQRAEYYQTVCKSLGLNPLTKPFEYLHLSGKLVLYALKSCTDQLRAIYGVSVTELKESAHEGIFVVTAYVRNQAGRTDASKGAVSIVGLKGEALANAMMKAETKAKRRATLSLCGLGFLDESEVDDIPAAAKQAPVSNSISQRAIAVRDAPIDEIPHQFHAVVNEEGDITPRLVTADDLGLQGFTNQSPSPAESASPSPHAATELPANHQLTPNTATEIGAGMPLADEARQAARRGRDALNALCKRLTKKEYEDVIKPMFGELQDIIAGFYSGMQSS